MQPIRELFNRHKPFMQPITGRLWINMHQNFTCACDVGNQLEVGNYRTVTSSSESRAVDPHSFFADPDPADFLMRIRIQH